MRISMTGIFLVLLFTHPGAVAQGTGDPNSFNRLMTEEEPCNQPPSEDGIHDPGNPGTVRLQDPGVAFEPLPDGKDGNCVDWVAALEEGTLNPRWSLTDPDAAPADLDLNIVREVKGSMPDVVYPHKEHTVWLDCSNCHPKIFTPKKGANQISMASILLGRQCGVCHGKVAFPVSDCLRCHSGGKRASASGDPGSDQDNSRESRGKIKNAQ